MSHSTQLFYADDIEQHIKYLKIQTVRRLIKSVTNKLYLYYPVNCEHWHMKKEKYLIENDKEAFEKKQYILSCLHNRLNNHSSTDKNE